MEISWLTISSEKKFHQKSNVKIDAMVFFYDEYLHHLLLLATYWTICVSILLKLPLKLNTMRSMRVIREIRKTLLQYLIGFQYSICLQWLILYYLHTLSKCYHPFQWNLHWFGIDTFFAQEHPNYILWKYVPQYLTDFIIHWTFDTCSIIRHRTFNFICFVY